ncbi:MAG: class I SAM-dependent methyltransferase [Anaerolineaceae bacterium]|nr:class I SAM-dependent methyltransferase [Anaerolineaceae bacterium]
MNEKINQQQQEKYEQLWDNEWHDLHKIGPSVRTRNRILLRYFKKFIQNGSIFDSGCGDGSFLLILNKHYQEKLTYHAGDISETAIAAVDKLDFVQKTSIMDIENKNTLPQETFTAVVSSEVLEHIENWKEALQNLVDTVAQKGFIFITVPAQMKYWSMHDEFAKHYRRFEQDQIEQELINAGFEIKESWCWGWPFYWLYYTLFLKRTTPQSVMKEITSPFKIFVSNILYYLFFIDDLFRTTKGRRLFIIAQKR